MHQYKHKNVNICIKSENSKTFKLNVFILKRTDKLDLRKDEKINALLNLSIYYTWKTIKAQTITINVRYQLQHGMISLNYLMGHILYQIFKIILSIFKKKVMKRLLILQQENM